MSDVCTGVFAKRRVVPEDVVALSVFAFACLYIYIYIYINFCLLGGGLFRTM